MKTRFFAHNEVTGVERPLDVSGASRDAEGSIDVYSVQQLCGPEEIVCVRGRASYCPAMGEERDGVCGCGRPAETEIQVGWHNGLDGGPSGGQYEELCQQCFDHDFFYDLRGNLCPRLTSPLPAGITGA